MDRLPDRLRRDRSEPLLSGTDRLREESVPHLAGCERRRARALSHARRAGDPAIAPLAPHVGSRRDAGPVLARGGRSPIAVERLLVSHHRSRPRRRHRGADDTPIRLARLDLPASLAGASVLDIGLGRLLLVRGRAPRRRARRRRRPTMAGTAAAGGSRPVSSWREPRSGRRSKTSTSTSWISPPDIASACSMSCSSSACCIAWHPLLALERIAAVTRKLLILETVVDMVGRLGRFLSRA